MITLSETEDRTVLGFWVYLMTDCILFATLFATYGILYKNTYGGPSGKELFDLRLVMAETFCLLISSFTCGLACLSAEKYNKVKTLLWFGVTFLLGAAFLTLELSEFAHLVREGNSWERSAFLSAFFTLVGTHGLHISFGLLWMLILCIPIFWQGINSTCFKRLTCLKLFWHFLDVVWIFIFTFVYFMGVL